MRAVHHLYGFYPGICLKTNKKAQDGKVVSPMHQPPLPPANIPGTHFCQWMSRSQGQSARGRIKSLKNANDAMITCVMHGQNEGTPQGAQISMYGGTVELVSSWTKPRKLRKNVLGTNSDNMKLTKSLGPEVEASR